ncbi:hypothetical protein F5Y11DRAFT_62038 [Daldinia sp. FL1419]|nr:hypothetical protein F5Y11DRAFT_62038 [Daldinia sp. FL1419]
MCPCGAACRCNPCRCGNYSNSENEDFSDSEQSPEVEHTNFVGEGRVLGPVSDGHRTGRGLDPMRVHQVIWTPIDPSYVNALVVRDNTQPQSEARPRVLIDDDDRLGEVAGHGLRQLILYQIERWQKSAATTPNGAPEPVRHYMLPDPHMREIFGDNYDRITPNDYMVYLADAAHMLWLHPRLEVLLPEIIKSRTAYPNP